jgi:hypothetical protein
MQQGSVNLNALYRECQLVSNFKCRKVIKLNISLILPCYELHNTNQKRPPSSRQIIPLTVMGA